MFRQRTSSQKPGDDLLANFRQQFPEVVTVSTDASAVPVVSQTATANHAIIINPPPPQKDCGPNATTDHEPFRDQDPTPRASHDQWRFTPSLLDPNAYSFGSFANAAGPGYYPPTAGGAGTLFHSQAGDLHTPTMSMVPGLGTPLSMPTSGDAMHPGATMVDMAGFQGLQAHHFNHFNPFLQPQQQGLAPATFVHRDAGYDAMEHDGSPMGSDACEDRMAPMAATLHSHDVKPPPPGHPLPASAEKFRFHSTLNAPTAMVRHADEIPVTYLNKGQAYSLSISDTSGAIPVRPGTRYRTFVRISFEDDEQRQKPGVCWSLWKEGRGTNEAHQRGGRLQAVEFVEAGQPAEGDDKRTRVELETSSFDGFSVIWTPGINGVPEVNVAVRFNFLSTDFSHSKGVKGIPVRLCAKTNPLPADASQADDDATAPEICFCKVKLFRDHGAERKLSNDVAHVKKSIDKLKQQLSQMESGIKDFGKRKRPGGPAKGSAPQRPGKVPKHKRTWSMSSASSAGGGGGGARMSMEEDLHFKLQTLQDMFTSTRPVSVLYLRGEESDDADLHPVSLPGDMSPPAKLTGSDGPREGPNWQARSAQSSATDSMVSPSPSSLSMASQASAAVAWKGLESSGGGAHGDASRKGSERPSKVPKTDDQGSLTGWIEALGVDASYRPPAERTEKPVACFYVAHQAGEEPEKQAYYRAVYLMKRTLEELNGRIASKWGIEAPRIQRTIRVVRGGLEVEMDDDVVRELKEGQDMRLEVEEVTWQARPGEHGSSWGASLSTTTDKSMGDEASEEEARAVTGLMLRLTF